MSPCVGGCWERLEKMARNDILACSREILKAKGIRNRAVERLGLTATYAKMHLRHCMGLPMTTPPNRIPPTPLVRHLTVLVWT